MCRAGHRVRHRGGIRLGHPCQGTRAGWPIRVRRSISRGDREDAPDRGGLRPPWRAAPGCRSPVPAGAPGGGFGDPGRVEPRAAGTERGMVPTPIPADLWAELKHEGLLRSDAPVPPAIATSAGADLVGEPRAAGSDGRGAGSHSSDRGDSVAGSPLPTMVRVLPMGDDPEGLSSTRAMARWSC